MRFALASRRVITETGLRPAAVLIDGERIEAVLDASQIGEGVEVRDLGDLVLMSGLVDAHVHINEPGRTEWEGFSTATQAAATGGVTTLVDMPLNCLPVTTTVRALEQKLEATDGRLCVDTGFWGGVVPGNERDLVELAKEGVLGCKAFLVHSGIDDFPNVTEEDLRRAMPRLADAGVPLLAHAELDLGAPDSTEDPRHYQRYLASRPREWEDAAIAMLIRLCRETGCAVHIVHLSSASAVPMLREAKAEGLPITVETCPHYLCLDAEHIPDGQTVYKCAPPIRGAENREGLWRALDEGVIDFVITDHSPCTPHLKKPEEGDFMSAWGGIASLSLGLPAIWTEASRRGFSLERIQRWMSEGPARFAGLYGPKGRLAPGADADLVAWDPDAEFVVEESRLHFRHKISPYLGQTLKGEVKATWLRGQSVYDGKAPPSRAYGRALLHRGGHS